VTATRTPRRRTEGQRQTILDAAFAVFIRHGFDEASLVEIADEAGMSEAKISESFPDKENLFLTSMASAADDVVNRNLATLEDLRDPDPDLETAFQRVAERLAHECHEGQGRDLRVLTDAEVKQFPQLVGVVYNRVVGGLADGLCGELAQLSSSGQLRPCDPDAATQQFVALLKGTTDARSRSGKRAVPAAEIRTVARIVVDTFLRAYGHPEARTAQPS
jgi:TetR/AcrR family transcriptional regulator, mexJK operon transcriptional repressor